MPRLYPTSYHMTLRWGHLVPKLHVLCDVIIHAKDVLIVYYLSCKGLKSFFGVGALTVGSEQDPPLSQASVSGTGVK